MDEAILMDADIHKGTKGGDVSDDAFKQHAGHEILHLMHAFGKTGGLEFRAWVTAGFFQLLENVLDGGQAEAVIRVLAGAQRAQHAVVAHDLFDGLLDVREDLFNHRIGFGVH